MIFTICPSFLQGTRYDMFIFIILWNLIHFCFLIFGDNLSGYGVKTIFSSALWSSAYCNIIDWRLVNMIWFSEILRVSGMLPNQGFGELDRLRHRSPSPMGSANLMSNVAGAGLSGWNGIPQEVIRFFFFNILSLTLGSMSQMSSLNQTILLYLVGHV